MKIHHLVVKKGDKRVQVVIRLLLRAASQQGKHRRKSPVVQCDDSFSYECDLPYPLSYECNLRDPLSYECDLPDPLSYECDLPYPLSYECDLLDPLSMSATSLFYPKMYKFSCSCIIIWPLRTMYVHKTSHGP